MTGVDDRVALRALVDGYAIAVDGRSEDGFRALWTPDACLTIHEAGGAATTTFDGVDQIVGVIRAIARYRQTLHVVGAHVVDIHGDEASGEASCIAHHLVGGDDGGWHDLVMVIRYVDRYVRQPDGSWRFRQRECRKKWTSRLPVEEHWEAGP